jgi:CRP-like cAMP-binding protein
MPNEKLYPEYQRLFSVFNSIYPLSDELKAAIAKETDVIQLKSKTRLLNAGDASNTIYFINKGAARVFYLNKEGKEITSWFLFENELLISVYGFFTGLPGFDCIETLEDCTCIVLRRDKLNKLYEKYLELNFIGRKLTEYYYIRNEKQTNDLRMLTAQQRYQELLNVNPKLLNRVSLGHIASYLGISQETLSRIRK